MRKPTPRAQKRPGHFIGADACRFFRHDHIGRYCVSTVGDFHPRGCPDGEWSPLGYFTRDGHMVPARYETAVFDLRAKRHRWQTLALNRCEDETTAKAYHAERVAEFTRIAARQARQREAKSHGGRTITPPKAKVGVVVRSPRGRRA